MKTNHHRFIDPATARAFIRNLADQFEDSEGMFEFLSACDMAQATLAYCLFKKQQYYCSLRTHYIRGTLSEREGLVEIEALCDEYSKASEEFLQATKKLQVITSKLNVADVDKIMTKKWSIE